MEIMDAKSRRCTISQSNRTGDVDDRPASLQYYSSDARDSYVHTVIDAELRGKAFMDDVLKQIQKDTSWMHPLTVSAKIVTDPTDNRTYLEFRPPALDRRTKEELAFLALWTKVDINQVEKTRADADIYSKRAFPDDKFYQDLEHKGILAYDHVGPPLTDKELELLGQAEAKLATPVFPDSFRP
jgi:hypothetical protein